MLPCHRLVWRQMGVDALSWRVLLRDFHARQTCCTADVTQSAIAREIELVGQRFEVDARQTSHGVEELLQPRRDRVQLLEYALSPACGFVLRLAGAKRFPQIVPAFERARVQPFQNSANLARPLASQVQSPAVR